MATTPFATRETAFCTRCQAHRTIERPWRGWVWVRRGWWITLAVLLPVSPIIAADYVVLIPSAIVFLTALGPLNDLAGRRPTCLTCGARNEHSLRVAT